MLLSRDTADATLDVAGFGTPADPAEVSRALGIPLPASLAAAVDRRKLEFLAGRACALEALRAVGYRGPGEIAIGRDRTPLWPAGYTGSISHSQGRAWAAAAPASVIEAIGIDLEHPLAAAAAAEIAPQVLAPPDHGLAGRSALGFEDFVTLVFSAKESVYKCLSPAFGIEPDFQQLAVESIDAPAGSMRVRFLDAAAVARAGAVSCELRFRVEAGVVRTAIEWRRDRVGRRAAGYRAAPAARGSG